MMTLNSCRILQLWMADTRRNRGERLRSAVPEFPEPRAIAWFERLVWIQRILMNCCMKASPLLWAI